MARPALTPTQARAQMDRHIIIMRRALNTLSAPLSDTDVCYCDDGSAAGITERECGCQYRDAARMLCAGETYVRRVVRDHLV